MPASRSAGSPSFAPRTPGISSFFGLAGVPSAGGSLGGVEVPELESVSGGVVLANSLLPPLFGAEVAFDGPLILCLCFFCDFCGRYQASLLEA